MVLLEFKTQESVLFILADVGNLNRALVETSMKNIRLFALAKNLQYELVGLLEMMRTSTHKIWILKDNQKDSTQGQLENKYGPSVTTAEILQQEINASEMNEYFPEYSLLGKSIPFTF